MNSNRIALYLGLVALALILGALGFQYFAHFPPCEMCHWQRWPHYAALALAIALFFAAQIGAAAEGVLVDTSNLADLDKLYDVISQRVGSLGVVAAR